jgi:hypothetical protein
VIIDHRLTGLPTGRPVASGSAALMPEHGWDTGGGCRGRGIWRGAAAWPVD